MSFELVGVQLVAQDAAQFNAAMASADKAVSGFGDQAGNTFRQMPSLSDIAVGALHKIGEVAVTAFLQAGQAAVGFFKDSVSAAGDFQQNFAEFGNAVGHTIDGTGLKLDDFKKQFISLGKELPVSTAEVEKAAIEMSRGGIDPAVIAGEGLRRTIQFASAAMKGDLVGAAQISAKTMQAWTNITDDAKTKTDFLSHAQDLMTQATTAASTTVDQLFLGLSNVGGSARLAGVSFDETTKALAQLTPSFASSADAGTSLKTFFIRLQPSTKPAIEAMQGLGLWTEKSGSAFYNAQGKFVGMAQAEKLLHDATKNLTDAQRQSVLQQIFGNDAINAASVFARQGADGYNALSDSIAKQTTLTEAAANNQNTYDTAVKNFKGSIEALQITIGSALLPALQALFKNYLQPGIDTVLTLTQAIFGDRDAFSSLAQPLQDVINFFNPFIDRVGALINNFFGIQTQTNDFSAALTSLGGAAQLAADNGISPFMQTVQKVSDYFQTNIMPILNDLATAVFPLVGAAIQVLGGIWTDVLVPAVHTAFDAFNTLILPVIKELAAWLADNLPPAIKTVADFLTGTLFPALHDVYDFIDTNVIPVVKDVIDWLAAKLTAAIQVCANFWNNTLWPALQKVWTFIQSNIIPIIQSLVVNYFTNLGTALVKLADFWSNTLWPALSKVWDFISTKIIPLFVALVNVNIALLQAAVKAMAEIWSGTLYPAIEKVYNWFNDHIAPVFGTVSTKADTLASGINKTLGPAFTWLNTNVLQPVAEWMGKIADKISNVVDWLNKLAEKIRNLPSIPSAFRGSSPPPLANWMGYIADQTERAAGAFQMTRSAISGLPASPAAIMAGSNTTTATYNQQRTVNLAYHTPHAPPASTSLAIANALAY